MTFFQNAARLNRALQQTGIVKTVLVQFPSATCWIGAELADKGSEWIDEDENKLYQYPVTH